MATTSPGTEAPGTGAIYRRLLGYSTRKELAIYAVGSVAAIGSGASLPLMTILFQRFVNTFNDFSQGKISNADLQDDIREALSLLCYLFIGKLILTYIFMICFSYAGTKLVQWLRLDYLSTILHGDITYFDLSDTSSVSANITTQATNVEKGVTEKIGFCIQNVAMTICAFTIALVYQWKLSLVVIALIPLLVIVVPATYQLYMKVEGEALGMYNELTSIETETISGMRTVKSFGMIPRILVKHAELSDRISKHGVKVAPFVGLQLGVVNLVTLSEFVLSFWYGIKLYVDGEVKTVGTIVLVFFALQIAFSGFTQISAHLIPLANAAAAGGKLFSEIDGAKVKAAQVGSRPTTSSGPSSPSPELSLRGAEKKDLTVSAEPGTKAPAIVYENVSFAYPTRPDVTVLDNFSCRFEAGKMTAVVGRSGSGKSTLVGLLEKWYKPSSGRITVDSTDLETLDSKTLRVGIGYVQQGTFLFNESILQNVQHGLVGSAWEHAPDAEKAERVKWACKEASAHDFIETLPLGYDTSVGESGNNLSSGQRQRIALARSIVADPRILILDEATSALDNRIQAVVKSALDTICRDRTTINISHRLSTIVDADHILVMDKGLIVEQGTHLQLVAAGGMYADMWDAQKMENAPDAPADIEVPGKEFNQSQSDVSTDGADDDLPIDSENISPDGQPKNVGLWYCILEIFYEMRGYWRYYLWALVACVIGGASYPMQAYFFGKMIILFMLPIPELASKKDFWSLMIFILTIVVTFGYTVLGWSLMALQRIIPPLYRHKYFEGLIGQDIAFFDHKGSATGALINRLSADPNAIQQLTGANIGLVIIGIFNLLGSSILVLIIGWKLGLVAIFGVLLPVCVSGYLNFRQHRWFEEAIENSSSESSTFASEAIGAIRTVVTLTLEDVVYGKYKAIMDLQHRRSMRRNAAAFAFSSLSQSIELLGMALIFWYGMRLIAEGAYTQQQLFTVFIATTFSAQTAGTYLAQLPDARLAQLAARRIRKIRHTVPPIEKSTTDADAPAIDLWPAEKTTPLIEFKNVSFAYPSAPHIPVLRDLNLKIYPGQFVAFVGSSGCGKSTTFSLLSRFYDPTGGSMSILSHPLTSINLSTHRAQIALVSQDPVLFAGSIRENLLPPDQLEDTAALEEACRQLGIYEFVTSLPEGYETPCTTSSGAPAFSAGQTQRLAAARVLLRKPKLLLLDEATSALDAISERALQGVLHGKGDRTVVAIAHRLETVREADLICVFDQGSVVESGTHDELMRLGGKYAEMAMA